MAPAAVDDQAVFRDPDVCLPPAKSGRALEEASDAVDAVNERRDEAKARMAGGCGGGSGGTFGADKDPAQFRQFDAACARVRALYAEQHAKQTVAFNLAARARFHSAARARPGLSVWEAMEALDRLVDASDPDTELSQIQHLVQSAEAMRRDGRPRWMQATGLVHDLGKLLCVLGLGGGEEDTEGGGQWAVVGDTFPVGCRFDTDAIVCPESLAANPDAGHPVYATECGIYPRHGGLDHVLLSWGHDEYLYLVLRDQSRLPPEGLAMIRYHSFYPWHREGAYRHLMADKDHALLAAVQAFNPYDLYSKSDDVPDIAALKPYYLDLIDEFFPPVIYW